MERDSLMQTQRFNQMEREMEDSLSELRLKIAKAGSSIGDTIDADAGPRAKTSTKELEKGLKLIK